MTRSASPSPDPRPATSNRPAGLQPLLWTAKLVGAGILAYAAYHKMTGNPGDIALFTHLGMEPIGRYLVGGLEGLAALAMVIPQSSVYGAFLGIGIMFGAIIAHLTEIGLDGMQYALLVMACCVTVLYIRRREAPFINNLWDD